MSSEESIIKPAGFWESFLKKQKQEENTTNIVFKNLYKKINRIIESWESSRVMVCVSERLTTEELSWLEGLFKTNKWFENKGFEELTSEEPWGILYKDVRFPSEQHKLCKKHKKLFKRRDYNHTRWDF